MPKVVKKKKEDALIVETIDEEAMQVEASKPVFPPATAQEVSGKKIEFRRVSMW